MHPMPRTMPGTDQAMGEREAASVNPLELSVEWVQTLLLGDPRFGSQGDPSSVLFKIQPLVGRVAGKCTSASTVLVWHARSPGSTLGTI